MDLPPFRVPLFIPEQAAPDATPAATPAAAPAASSARVGLEASCHNPASAPAVDALLQQQKLAGLAEWRASIVARVGAATAAAILTDVDAALPAIVDDPSISLQELSFTCASLDERLIEMAASYRAPSRSLSLLQASLDRTAPRLVDPSTTDRSPSPTSSRPSGGAASTGVSRVVPHGRRVRMSPVWDNALQCGGGWIAWKQRFLSKLELSGIFTEAQKLAKLRNNVVPELCSFLNWDMERHRLLSTPQEGLDALTNLYALSYALNPKQIFASKVAQLRQERAESMKLLKNFDLFTLQSHDSARWCH
ncbi:MAG: hypothetical protein BJ554DRAFT_4567 [Olpidium bornovanus]|uniref:Uncharacterized protein n=1 Tax=Olpidium bornovanus TaxID=278681 RepID=A0A8H8DLD0_9FUNG|nr:MAG: hypothetical protein BJ554DRAFT_4567 [Olpidium bornovanus]